VNAWATAARGIAVVGTRDELLHDVSAFLREGRKLLLE